MATPKIRSRVIKETSLPSHISDVLVFSPTYNDLANRIMECEGQSDYMVSSGITWGKFEDGFPNLMIKDVENLRARDVVFLADMMNLQDIFSQFAVLYALPRYCVKSLTVVLPYFPTGTMERVDTEGQVATAMTLATMLSSIPLTSTGPPKLVIYDIHALQERFYFAPTIIPILVTAVPLFLDALKENHSDEDIAIAFPDEGAMKRFGGQFKGFELILCSKVRDGDKRIVVVKEGEAKDKHVFIVDDLVKTGGTLLECKGAIMRQGANKVSAFVTHAVFPQDSWQRFAHGFKPPEGKDSLKLSFASTSTFTHFYTTDSCPTTTNVIKDKAPFQVLSLAHTIADVVKSLK